MILQESPLQITENTLKVLPGSYLLVVDNIRIRALFIEKRLGGEEKSLPPTKILPMPTFLKGFGSLQRRCMDTPIIIRPFFSVGFDIFGRFEGDNLKGVKLVSFHPDIAKDIRGAKSADLSKFDIESRRLDLLNIIIQGILQRFMTLFQTSNIAGKALTDDIRRVYSIYKGKNCTKWEFMTLMFNSHIGTFIGQQAFIKLSDGEVIGLTELVYLYYLFDNLVYKIIDGEL